MKNFQFLLFLFVSYSAIGQSVISTSILQEEYNGNYKIFNSYIQGQQVTLFKKKSIEGIKFVEEIMINKPTHIFYSDLSINQSGSLNKYGSLIVFPGDDVQINNNKIVKSTGYPNYIDSLLILNKDDYSSNQQTLLKTIQANGFEEFVKQINKTYADREVLVRGNIWKLDSNKKKILINFNKLITYKKISSIPFEKLELTPKNKNVLDSLFEDLNTNIKIIEQFDSPFNITIYYNLIRYQAFKMNIMSTDFWGYAFKINPKLQNNEFYIPYLVSKFKSDYNFDPNLLTNLISKLQSLDKKNSKILTFEKILKTINSSKLNFSKAKIALSAIEEGKYNYVLGNEHIEKIKRSIKQIGSISFINVKNENSLPFSELIKSKKSITVLDFWASWCIPCIAEQPSLEKIKKEFQNQPVQFFQISIDKDIDKWKKMVTKFNNNTASQYLVTDSQRKEVITFFNLTSIPRYVVINYKGDVLNFNFIRPSDPDFSNSLRNFLIKLK